MRGVVAAGHPLTAEAGAAALREGGNAVDAAVAAVLMSFVAESPLTGPGAGGFMLVHTAGGENHLLDFFVAAPGRGLASLEPAELQPIDVKFAENAIQRFNVGPSSCGAYGTTLGLAQAAERFGTLPLGELCAAPARAAREGLEVVPMQAFLFTILGPDPHLDARGGGDLRAGGAAARGRRDDPAAGARGPAGAARRRGARLPVQGRHRQAGQRVGAERGGLLTEADLAGYGVVEREPVKVAYHGREVVTNPPPSSGGILIADALAVLERSAPRRPVALAETFAEVNRARDEEFLEGLRSEGYLERFLAKDALDNVATEVRSRLGNTTHISVMDADGACASVTCSNGSCSGVVVPGTGVHLNNMLGEEDLNPLGYHRHKPGTRVPSMMAPTVVLRDGRPRWRSGRRARTGSGPRSSRRSWRSSTTAPRRRRRYGARGCTWRATWWRPSRASTSRRSTGSSGAAGPSAAGGRRTSSSAASRRLPAAPSAGNSPGAAILGAGE